MEEQLNEWTSVFSLLCYWYTNCCHWGTYEESERKPEHLFLGVLCFFFKQITVFLWQEGEDPFLDFRWLWGERREGDDVIWVRSSGPLFLDLSFKGLEAGARIPYGKMVTAKGRRADWAPRGTCGYKSLNLPLSQLTHEETEPGRGSNKANTTFQYFARLSIWLQGLISHSYQVSVCDPSSESLGFARIGKETSMPRTPGGRKVEEA